MELRHLRYFATVVEAGSLTAAAERLHMSQPPLSVAIGKLEAELGVALLVRSPRGVEPTSAGRYLLDASTRVLGEIDEITTVLRRFGAGLAGSLRLAAVPVLMWHRVPELLRGFARQAPDVDVSLVDPPPWTAIDMLHDRSVDIAAIMVDDAERFARRHRDTVDIVDWGPVPLVAALPPDASDAPDPLPLEWFNDRTVVLPQRTAAVPSLPEAVDAAFRRHHVVPAIVRTLDTIQTSIPLVEAGIASTILPDPDGRSLSRFDLTVRPLAHPPRPLRALALARAGASRDTVVARFLAQIESHASTNRV